jgi:hypothetical protein
VARQGVLVLAGACTHARRAQTAALAQAHCDRLLMRSPAATLTAAALAAGLGAQDLANSLVVVHPLVAAVLPPLAAPAQLVPAACVGVRRRGKVECVARQGMVLAGAYTHGAHCQLLWHRHSVELRPLADEQPTQLHSNARSGCMPTLLEHLAAVWPWQRGIRGHRVFGHHCQRYGIAHPWNLLCGCAKCIGGSQAQGQHQHVLHRCGNADDRLFVACALCV